MLFFFVLFCYALGGGIEFVRDGYFLICRFMIIMNGVFHY